MDNEISTIPQADPNQPFFVLFFNRPDKIKILSANRETLKIVVNACSKSWSRGFQTEAYNDDCSFRLKFVGNPFLKTNNSVAAINTRSMATHILSDLFEAGWEFALSSDLTKYHDLSTWFFQRPANVRRQILPNKIICLSPSSTNCLHLIGADQSMSKILIDVVQLAYEPGIEGEPLCLPSNKCFELVLNGHPWASSDTHENLQAKKMLLEIIRRFNRNHYRLYATGDLQGTTDNLFFINQPDIDPTHDRFCMINLHADNRLQMIDCPTEVIQATKQAIFNSLSDTLQRIQPNLERQDQDSRYIDFFSGVDTAGIRSFLTSLVFALLQKGWCLTKALDVSRGDDDRSVFLLRSYPLTSIPHFCLNLCETDKIRLIDAPADIADVAKRVAADRWLQGIVCNCDAEGILEITLKGNPWTPLSSEESRLARVLTTKLLAAFAQRGWRVIGNIDLSVKYDQDTGPNNPIDVHSWFFTYAGFSQTPTDTASAPPLTEAVSGVGFSGITTELR